MKVGMRDDMHRMDEAAESVYGLPAVVLMENAGRKTAEAMADMLGGLAGRTVCVLAGSGNNGGDAFSAARHMAGEGAHVRAFLAGDPAHFGEAAASMYHCVLRMGIEVHPLDGDRDWDRLQLAMKFSDGIVDGILGTGFRGELRKKTLRLIELVNAAGRPVLSIDIPSGVEADTGRVSTVAVHAARTLTFALPKPGLFLSPGGDCTGEVDVDRIGMPLPLLEDAEIHQGLLDADMARTLLPVRPRSAHKGSCGQILVVAGSRGMMGAATLASRAALRAGAGIVTLAVPESLHDVMEGKLTEVMTVPLPESASGTISGDEALEKLLQLEQNCDAALVGPGLGRSYETGELVRAFLKQAKHPVVLDADGIYAYTGQADALAACGNVPILTPHLGEMARLLGIKVEELREDLIGIARDAAKEYQAVFVLKSESTIVVYPDGDAYFTTTGNPGMATAGCGDVLAGTIAGLMKQTEAAAAPLLGVWLHGKAGDLAYAELGDGLIASDVLGNLPTARKTLFD